MCPRPLCFLILSSCAKKISTSTAGTPKVSPIDKPSTASVMHEKEIAGNATYTAKCARCHGLKAVENYTADSWTNILNRMAPKARLDSIEKINVLGYVHANSKK